MKKKRNPHLGSTFDSLLKEVGIDIDAFKELFTLEQIKQHKRIKKHIDNGVSFANPNTTSVDPNVTIGEGSFIGAGVHLRGTTAIGANCHIYEYSILENVTIENNVTIYSHSILKDSHINSGAAIGPFAHITAHTTIKEDAIIGNFVEVKRSTIGTQSKAKHLAYLGDAQLGNNVNIGAGTITCNHDGNKKHPTIIKDNAYIGSNNTLVAPLTIEQDAYTAAGSTITESVPSQALAIGRARQVNKEGYAQKLRRKKVIPGTEQDSFVAACKTDKNDTDPSTSSGRSVKQQESS